MKHPEQFVGTMTEKMLTYALGRGLEYYDMPVVRVDREGFARETTISFGDRLGIVKSTPFQMKKSSQRRCVQMTDPELN